MTRVYVLGFAEDGAGNVVLITKKRPEWQAGLLNGVGGKVESEETYSQAMEREFFEETGVRVPSETWTYRGSLSGGGFLVMVYHVIDPEVAMARTASDEVITVFPLRMLDQCTDMMVDNVPVLIGLCRLEVSQPPFEIRY